MNVEAIEALREETQRFAQHASMLQLAFVGISTGLLEALADRPGSADELAARAGIDAGYCVRWCEAAYAFGLLEYASPHFRLSVVGAAYRPSAAGTLMPFAVQSVLGAHMAERAATYARTGERPGERELAGCEAALPWFGAMLEASFGGLFAREILPSLPAFARLAERDGLAVDLGCGNGWYLRKLLTRYPRLRGLGVDGFAENVQQATSCAEAEGLGTRLRFAVADVHTFTLPEQAQLIALNRALHHVWERREDLFARLHESLSETGTLVIWEPAWPAELTQLQAPRWRSMAFQNLSEHVQGNHFLRPGEIALALERAGFAASIHTFAQGAEAVVVGTR